MGFAVQTLTYTEADYELAELKTPGGARWERTVALVIDETSRIRRRHGGSGYILETFDGTAWRVSEVFASAEEVAANEAYRQCRRAQAAEAETDGDMPGEE